MSTTLTQDQIREYADKWLKGTITVEEKELFEQWYNTQAPGSINWNEDEQEDELRAKIFNNLDAQIQEDKKIFPFVRSKKTIIWRIAAAVAVLTVLGIAVFNWMGPAEKIQVAENKQAGTAGNAALDKTTGYTRHLTLPDGSTVILNANSKLDYPENFSGNAREVILVGEAYFDIMHDDKKPFIIHTGQIKTTVLGTAFNINAYPDARKIIISVTRGKVKVEDNKKVLAVLTPDQQIICNVATEEAVPQTMNSIAGVTDWAKQDMVFEDVSFEKVAELLNRRYAVDISFKNPALRNCTVKAFFNGTESLEKVLDVLSIISNVTYATTDNKTIVIDGKGCAE
ncbi:MAG: FecR domain-containing protein [Chitinophagaceae bacterium]